MPWLGTFHSICVKILRMHAELVGLRPNFTILDSDDQLRLLKQILQAENLDDTRWPARSLASVIDGWKNRGLDPQHAPASKSASFAGGRGVALYAVYEARLKALNAVDFGGLLLESLRLFREHGDVLADFQQQFRYILVDEYQDTNVVQYLWLRLLAQANGNLCCVGDDDQSIYGWRGADVDNILRFEKDFAGAKVIRLERNYRSGGHILAVASGLIAHNQSRLGKRLFTDAPLGERPTVTGVWDSQEEARVIGEAIESAQRAGVSLDDIAMTSASAEAPRTTLRPEDRSDPGLASVKARFRSVASYRRPWSDQGGWLRSGVRALVMTATLIVVGFSLQFPLYALPFQLDWLTRSWLTVNLPRIVLMGFGLSLIIGVVTETRRLIGGPLLTSVVLGIYHRPIRQQLIVMFLDIANSTRLTESMGELRVHDLITRFFFDIDEPITDYGGAVRAYVGDEVIVSWPLTGDPARNTRCVACFLAIERKIARLAGEGLADICCSV